jgi:3-isopropylmalate dehydrogenase
MLLRWHAQRAGKTAYSQAAQAIDQAVENCIANGECTRDVGGQLGTQATGQAVVKRLA